MIEDLPALCADKFGRLVVLYLLSPRNGKYMHPAHITTLTLGDSNAFSKKDRDVRLKYGLDDLYPLPARSVK